MVVGLYVPNIIDYIRAILLFFIPFYYNNITITLLLFFFVFALDGIDGNIARKLKQTSRFGDMLDLFIDLTAELILLIILITFYTKWMPFFAMLAILTVFGHFAHVYLAAFGDKKFDFRKQNQIGRNRILKNYLKSGYFMSFLQISWYLFLGGLYINHFFSSIGLIISVVFFIPFLLRLIVLFFMLVDSYLYMLNLDNKKTQDSL